jgi:hypothetical protein
MWKVAIAHFLVSLVLVVAANTKNTKFALLGVFLLFLQPIASFLSIAFDALISPPSHSVFDWITDFPIFASLILFTIPTWSFFFAWMFTSSKDRLNRFFAAHRLATVHFVFSFCLGFLLLFWSAMDYQTANQINCGFRALVSISMLLQPLTYLFVLFVDQHQYLPWVLAQKVFSTELVIIVVCFTSILWSLCFEWLLAKLYKKDSELSKKALFFQKVWKVAFVHFLIALTIILTMPRDASWYFPQYDENKFLEYWNVNFHIAALNFLEPQRMLLKFIDIKFFHMSPTQVSTVLNYGLFPISSICFALVYVAVVGFLNKMPILGTSIQQIMNWFRKFQI